MSEHILQIPAPIENGMMIPTLDGQGSIWLYKDEITKSYIDYAAETEGLMLEIGAGYGHIILEVLKNPGYRQWLVDNAYEDLERRFNWPKLAKQTESVYQRVVQERSQDVW